MEIRKLEPREGTRTAHASPMMIIMIADKKTRTPRGDENTAAPYRKFPVSIDKKARTPRGDEKIGHVMFALSTLDKKARTPRGDENWMPS